MSHNPCDFVVNGYKENVKEITYYCKDCYNKRNLVTIMRDNDNIKEDIVIDLKNNYEVDETNVIFISCNDCKFKLKLENSHQRIRNFVNCLF